MTRLSATGLHVSYRNRPVLRGVDLSVPQGDVHAVLGPSGSGKTTLLRALAGLVPLEKGRVFLDGRDVSALPPERRGIVLVPQESALFPHLDVHDNVAFGLRDRHSATAKRRVHDLLAVVGLAGVGDRSVDHLSGGERQRVALARALAVEPSVILLDEPLGSLDGPLRTALRADLRRILRTTEATALHVTHDREEAFALADGILLLDEGRIVDAGAPRRVHDAPATTHAARLLGHRNLVPYEVVQERVATAWGNVDVTLPDGAPHRGILLLPADRLEAVMTGAPDGPRVATIEYVGGAFVVELEAAGSRLWTRQTEVPGLVVGHRARLRVALGPVHALADDS